MTTKKQTKKAVKKPSKQTANKSASAGKRGAQPAKAKNKSAVPAKSNLKKGAALRTRDEFLQGGVEKEEYKNNPKKYYRVVYTVEVNELNEAAVVKRSTKKGRHLKTKPEEKFHEEIITKDNEGKGIKVGKKFVRSKVEDIQAEDVEYILKRCGFYPDTKEKLKEFKSRKKK